MDEAEIAADGRGGLAHSPAADLEQALIQLESWGAARDWCGPDPYEGLNARRMGALRRTSLGRRILIQAVKPSPVDLRRPLAIPARHNAAALAHVLDGYARASFLAPPARQRQIERVASQLQALSLPEFDLPSWGYHFDVETRVFFYSRTMPNTIATAFAGLALITAYERTGAASYLDLATRAGEFFLAHVPQTEARGGAFFGYLVGDRSPIHNSNMLACALLARLHRHEPRQAFAEASRAGVGYCLAHQRPDGSWPYGERPGLDWVDGFHTGYVLDALAACGDAEIDPAIEPALERGLDFYERNLFLDDGTPKYYATGVWPVDSQSVAQAIQTLSAHGHRDARYRDRSRQVLSWALRNMRRQDGAFLFQRRRYWRNSVPHVRWAQAPMFAAMAAMAEAEAPEGARGGVPQPSETADAQPTQ